MVKVTEYKQELQFTLPSWIVLNDVVRYNLSKSLFWLGSWVVEFEYRSNYTLSWNLNFKLWNNNNAVITFPFSIQKWTYKYTQDFNAPINLSQYTGTYSSHQSWGWTYIFNTSYYKITVNNTFTAKRYLWKPRELKQIAQKATTTIFWLHTDNSWVTQDAE